MLTFDVRAKAICEAIPDISKISPKRLPMIKIGAVLKHCPKKPVNIAFISCGIGTSFKIPKRRDVPISTTPEFIRKFTISTNSKIKQKQKLDVSINITNKHLLY